MADLNNNDSTKKNKSWTSQVSKAMVLLVILLAVFIYLLTVSKNLAIFWITGICFGFVLQKSRFCFTASFRDPYLTGSTAISKAVLVALALTTMGFTLIKYFAFINGDTIPGQEYISPITIGTIIGGILFGIGMVIAGGCASGTLMRIGDGFQIQIVSLVFFIIGSTWGARDIGWWDELLIISEYGIFLPDIFGWIGALSLQLFIIVILYLIADKWEKRNTD